MSSGVSSDEEGFSGRHQTQNKMNQGSSSMPHSKDDNLIGNQHIFEQHVIGICVFERVKV